MSVCNRQSSAECRLDPRQSLPLEPAMEFQGRRFRTQSRAGSSAAFIRSEKLDGARWIAFTPRLRPPDEDLIPRRHAEAREDLALAGSSEVEV